MTKKASLPLVFETSYIDPLFKEVYLKAACPVEIMPSHLLQDASGATTLRLQYFSNDNVGAPDFLKSRIEPLRFERGRPVGARALVLEAAAERSSVLLYVPENIHLYLNLAGPAAGIVVADGMGRLNAHLSQIGRSCRLAARELTAVLIQTRHVNMHVNDGGALNLFCRGANPSVNASFTAGCRDLTMNLDINRMTYVTITTIGNGSLNKTIGGVQDSFFGQAFHIWHLNPKLAASVRGISVKTGKPLNTQTSSRHKPAPRLPAAAL